MLHLVDRTVAEIGDGGGLFARLPDAVQAQVRGFTPEQLHEAATAGLTRPQPEYISPGLRVVMNPVLAVQYLTAFEELELPRTLRAFEPCTGSSEPVVLAVDAYTQGQGSYVSLNLNRPLAAQLRAKLQNVRIDVTIIEDDARRSPQHLEPGTCDVACFHHAINDILQTAVSEPRGMDTRTVDWWPNERQMIEWLGADYDAGRIGDQAKPALLEAVAGAVELVKPGGWLLFDHWTWVKYQHVDWFPWQLFTDMVPLAMEWIAESGLPLEERPLQGRDPRWWRCLRRA